MVPSMAERFSPSELEDMIEGAQDQLRAIARIQTERAQLIGTGTASRRRVTVSVNADGVVIETKFAADAEDLELSEIAKAVTEAAQNAARDLADKNRELMAPLRGQRARMPRLADLLQGMPDLRGNMPTSPKPSLAPPNSPERVPPNGAPSPADMPTENPASYEDAVSYEDAAREQQRDTRSRTTEAGW